MHNYIVASSLIESIIYIHGCSFSFPLSLINKQIPIHEKNSHAVRLVPQDCCTTHAFHSITLDIYAVMQYTGKFLCGT